MSDGVDPRFRELGHPDIEEMDLRPANHYIPYWDTLEKVLPYAAPATFLAAGVGAGLGAMKKKDKEDKHGT